MTPNALDALRALAKDIEDAKIPGVRSELKIAQRLRAILRAEEERAADRTFTIYEAGSHHAIATVPNPFDPAIDRETISGGPTEAGAKAEVDAVVHEAADKALVAALTYKEAKAPWDRICPVCGHGFAVDVNAKAEAGVTPFDDHEVVADDLHKLGWTSIYDDAQWEHLREWCREIREQWLTRPAPADGAGLREKVNKRVNEFYGSGASAFSIDSRELAAKQCLADVVEIVNTLATRPTDAPAQEGRWVCKGCGRKIDNPYNGGHLVETSHPTWCGPVEPVKPAGKGEGR